MYYFKENTGNSMSNLDVGEGSFFRKEKKSVLFHVYCVPIKLCVRSTHTLCTSSSHQMKPFTKYKEYKINPLSEVETHKVQILTQIESSQTNKVPTSYPHAAALLNTFFHQIHTYEDNDGFQKVPRGLVILRHIASWLLVGLHR